jgi:hypothetical protein
MLMLLANLANDLKDTELAICITPITERLKQEETRVNPRTAHASPNRVNDRTLSELPKLPNEYNETLAANRAKFLKLMLDPRLAVARIDVSLARRAKPRKDMELPKCPAPRADMPDANRANARKLMELPICFWSNTDNW